MQIYRTPNRYQIYLSRDKRPRHSDSRIVYQMNFLRAILDGVHSEFTTQEVLQKYQLGSSANVSIVKWALVKKELIEIEKRQAVIPDPVMTGWQRRELGISTRTQSLCIAGFEGLNGVQTMPQPGVVCHKARKAHLSITLLFR